MVYSYKNKQKGKFFNTMILKKKELKKKKEKKFDQGQIITSLITVYYGVNSRFPSTHHILLHQPSPIMYNQIKNHYSYDKKDYTDTQYLCLD